MSLAHKASNALKWIPPLFLAALLTGCGSGDGGGGKKDCGGDLVIALTAGLSCLGTVTTSSPATQSESPPPASASQPSTIEPEPTQGTAVIMNRVTEYETNNSFDNANPVSFAAANADQHVGIEITGRVERESDGADFFVLTPTRTDTYAVYLCGDTCTEHPATDEIYIAVYDQSQTTIAATPVGTVAEQIFTVDLEAGLAYYIEINGYNTVFEYDYKLVLID
jgi:hypothetical protein